MMLELDHIRLLQSSFGEIMTVAAYRDFFKAINALHKMKMHSLYAVLKEYDIIEALQQQTKEST
jgi:hypothetical protein